MTLSDIGLPSDLLLWHAALLAVISFQVGILGGFVGLALGTLRLPAMRMLRCRARCDSKTPSARLGELWASPE